ncbi:unnamed protein product, partial [Cyprideis torosa]
MKEKTGQKVLGFLREFRRDEYPSHYEDAHCNIQQSVDGWLEQRCPLAPSGCDFAIRIHQVSCVCRQFREVAASLLERKGIVSVRWKKIEEQVPSSVESNSTSIDKGSPGRKVCWKIQEFHWGFTTGFAPISKWKFVQPKVTMAQHLQDCSFNDRGTARSFAAPPAAQNTPEHLPWKWPPTTFHKMTDCKLPWHELILSSHSTSTSTNPVPYIPPFRLLVPYCLAVMAYAKWSKGQSMDFLAAAFLPFAGTPARAAMTAAVAVGGLVSAGALMVARRLNLFYIWSHNVDKNTKRNGGDLVADVLKAHGVETIFTLSGGHISPILVGAEKKGIQIIDTRHEVNAVFAADAVARLTGRVGVACVTAGPGLTNTITAVKNAQMAESPLLLLGGAAATLLKGRGALQDIDQVSLFQSLCKHIVTVTAVRDIVPELRKAIQIARSGTPGPVFVELPLDVLYPYYLVQKEIGGATPGKTVQQKLVNWYLDKYLANIYAGAFENRDLSPLPVNIPMPSTSDVSTCATFLTQSRRPVLVLGSQVMLPPTKPEELQQAIKDLGVPCFLGGMSRGLLGRNSSIQFRHCRRDALKDADLILLV